MSFALGIQQDRESITATHSFLGLARRDVVGNRRGSQKNRIDGRCVGNRGAADVQRGRQNRNAHRERDHTHNRYIRGNPETVTACLCSMPIG